MDLPSVAEKNWGGLFTGVVGPAKTVGGEEDGVCAQSNAEESGRSL